jgi:sugar O-acyltransferase (sialic acid O-acetyltransferase NeuD family)
VTSVPVPQRLVIVGAGGHGRETLDIVRSLQAQGVPLEFLGFLDDAPGHPDRLDRIGAAVLGDTGAPLDADVAYVLGIGDPLVRHRLDQRFGERTAAVLVHPRATVGADVDLAPGVLVAAGSHVTTNVRLGRHTHLNVGAVVSHDCEIGAYVSLSPGVLVNGDVAIADGVFLGTGAVVLPGRTIGVGATVGAGAVVTHDVPPGVTVRGVPAR